MRNQASRVTAHCKQYFTDIGNIMEKAADAVKALIMILQILDQI